LLWLNSPSNPTGEVLTAAQMAAILDWARGRGIVVASDECYALLPWTVDEVPSVLDPRVNGGDLDGVLCVYSLSKQSNLAGYRAAFVAGDPSLVGELVAVRKQAGMMLPGPVQAAMTVALGDDAAVAAQREVYRSRRAILEPALQAAGGTIHGSQAGLYLWTSFGEDSMTSVERLADLGVLVAPGMFYGEGGANSVRVALTATDERISAAARRLSHP
ncbi:MAG: aminotransferase class I/II-fold pyridoxal phosphate-dependent enzyme, partial [Brachybacterium tyrofermentans]